MDDTQGVGGDSLSRGVTVTGKKVRVVCHSQESVSSSASEGNSLNCVFLSLRHVGVKRLMWVIP